MKLDKRYLNKCYHDAMIMQYKDTLREDGFEVLTEERFTINNNTFEADL